METTYRRLCNPEIAWELLRDHRCRRASCQCRGHAETRPISAASPTCNLRLGSRNALAAFGDTKQLPWAGQPRNPRSGTMTIWLVPVGVRKREWRFLHPTNAQERAENHANSFDYMTKKDDISVKHKKLKSILPRLGRRRHESECYSVYGVNV